VRRTIDMTLVDADGVTISGRGPVPDGATVSWRWCSRPRPVQRAPYTRVTVAPLDATETPVLVPTSASAFTDDAQV